MVCWLKRTVADPGIDRHLLYDEGEVVVDEVRKHWVVYLRPAAEGVLALALLALGVFVPVAIVWVPWMAALALAFHAASKALEAHTDRFVITNMRVFRVRGVLSQRMATMPLARILDISVVKPVTGRLFGYGHFVFESLGKDRGLRDIRFVGRPDERDLAIQRVVQRSGSKSEPQIH